VAVLKRKQQVRRRAFALASGLLMVATFGVAMSCSTVSGNVTLIRTRPGEVSTLVAFEAPREGGTLQVRFTSGTGRSIAVTPYQMINGSIGGKAAPTTVVDTGAGGPWTSVSPVRYTQYPWVPPDRIALRLTTSSTADLQVAIEGRTVDGALQPIGTTTQISPFGADCGRVAAHTDLRATNLSGLDLRACVIPGVTVDPSRLTNTDLRGADLSAATVLPGGLVGTTLDAVRLGNSTLASVDFSSTHGLATAELPAANLDHTVLRGVSLTGADLTGTSLVTATLEGVSSGGIVGAPALPSGWLLRSGFLIHRTANLSGGHLNGVDLSGLDLSGVNLATADLTAANLQGTNLTGADLSGATLVGTNLAGTKLANANLARSLSGPIVGTPASLPVAWKLSGGYLFGPGAGFIGANLSGFDLHGLDLSGSSFFDANLTGADLHGTDLTNAYLSGVTLSGNMRNTKLGGVQMSFVTFTNVDLTGATGTPIYGDTDFSTTTCPDGTLGSAHGNTCTSHPWP